jgi:hypothetical protein
MLFPGIIKKFDPIICFSIISMFFCAYALNKPVSKKSIGLAYGLVIIHLVLYSLLFIGGMVRLIFPSNMELKNEEITNIIYFTFVLFIFIYVTAHMKISDNIEKKLNNET